MLFLGACLNKLGINFPEDGDDVTLELTEEEEVDDDPDDAVNLSIALGTTLLAT